MIVDMDGDYVTFKIPISEFTDVFLQLDSHKRLRRSLKEDVLSMIVDDPNNENYIKAIKYVRKVQQVGLKEAKLYVDKIRSDKNTY